MQYIKNYKKSIGFGALGLLFYKYQTDIIGCTYEYIRKKHSHYIKEYLPHRIILVRHGESEGNVNNTIYAYVPDNQISITEKGKKQARQIGKQLKEMVGDNFVHFYYSPFLRTKQTFNEIAQSFDSKNYTAKEDPRIRELEWGNLQLWTLQEEMNKKIKKDRKQVGPFYFRFENGESGADVYDRTSQFIGSMKRHLKKIDDCRYRNRDVIIVAHGLVIRLFIMRYFKMTVQEYYTMKNPDNCECWILEKQQNGKYIFLVDNKIKPDLKEESVQEQSQ